MKKERVDSEITAESPQDNEFVSDAFQEDQINEEDLKKEMEMLGVEDGKFKDEGMMITKQGTRVWSPPGPILLWRLIMK